MTERLAKRLLIVVSVVWMAVTGGFLLRQHTDPELAALRQHQFEQKLKDCKGSFSERYECTSALRKSAPAPQRAGNPAAGWSPV